MKKLFLFLILGCFPLAIFCQDEDSTKPKKFLIGFSFSPDYSFRTLKYAGNNSDYLVKYRDSIEIPKFGFTTGFNFGYIVNKKLIIVTGLLFSDKGENTIRLTDFRTLTPDPSIPKYLSFKYHYLYIDIPIKANYFLINNRTKFFLSGGISTNVFITQKHKAILEFDDGKIIEKTYVMQNRFSRINFAFTAGFGFG